MSIERDEGYAALQRGDIAAAVERLERACEQTPDDYYAFMYLGAAYGQAERHADAVKVLTRAVELDPANAQARYNLGIALERAGWPQEALTAYQQALTLQPDYPKAREAAMRLQASQPAGAQSAPFTVDPLASRTMQMEREQAAHAYSEPTGQMGAMPAHPSAPPPVYSPGVYTPQTAYIQDNFSLGQSFRDWIAVIRSPKAFFADQVGREGFNAPLSMLSAYNIVFGIVLFLGSLIAASSSPAGLPFLLIGLLIVLAIFFVIWLVVTFCTAGLVHLVGKIFGNSASYAGSFRACAYAQAPVVFILCLGTLLTPGTNRSAYQSMMQQNMSQTPGGTYTPSSPGGFNNPGVGSPSGFPDLNTYQTQRETSPLASFVALCNFAGFIWSLVVLGIGVSHIQRISTGGAVGTVILGVIVPLGLLCLLLFFMMAAFLAALFGGMAAAR